MPAPKVKKPLGISPRVSLSDWVVGIIFWGAAAMLAWAFFTGA